MQKDKISNYGHAFQSKLIACLMTDAAFMARVYDLIKDEYFESESVKFLINRSLQYFKEYKKVPTLEVFKVNIDKLEDELLKQEVINTLRSAARSANASDLEFIKEETVKFCKNQELSEAILQSATLLKRGNYDEIQTLVQNALKVGMNTDIGLEYFSDIDRRYAEDSRNTISTGWPVIDELLKGGLAAGELGLFIAPSGAGKSWLLASMGANMVKEGYTVAHYTLELDENYTGVRYDSILTGISLDKIANHVHTVKERLADIKGELIIKAFSTKSVSLMGLRAHLTKLKMLGIDPDVVIIDYADLLKFENEKLPKHESLEALYAELRGFGGEFNVPVWTVSQSNREGLNNDIIEADKTSGAYAKIFTPDFIASLSRKAQDKLSNTARMHLIKNRFGPDGLTFPVTMDTSRGSINVHDSSSDKGTKATKKMLTDSEFDKRRLNQRLQQIGNKKIINNRDGDTRNNLF